MKPTDEQKTIIESTGPACVDAVAGSGKTSLLVQYAKARPRQRILCLTFNRSVKLLNQQRFLAAGCKNVRVETGHSLGYANVVPAGRYKIAKNGLALTDIVGLCGLSNIDPAEQMIFAGHIYRALVFFCNVATTSFSSLDYTCCPTSPAAREFAQIHHDEIIGHARFLLGEMYQRRLPLIHDAYLKFFQLQKPNLSGFDVIMVDEAQDIGGSMLDVYMRQPADLILVGDAHQSIYGFRHAVNAMAMAPYPHFPLSTSFRFGPEIASLAKKILRMKRSVEPSSRVPGIRGAGPADLGQSHAVLARGNLQLIKEAMAVVTKNAGAKLHFEGGLQSYTCLGEGSSLFDILHLRTGRRSQIRSAFIASFPDYQALEHYIEATNDQELRLAAKIVDEYSLLLFDLVRRLKAAQVERKDAEITFSTVHKAKGFEYDQVELVEGFIDREMLSSIKRKLIENDDSAPPKEAVLEEINILYVAATRAAKKLTIDFEI